MSNEAAERLLASSYLAAYRDRIRAALREERAAERKATVERIRLRLLNGDALGYPTHKATYEWNELTTILDAEAG